MHGPTPYDTGWPIPPCPLRALTGLLCPFCGGTRMTYELLHGDLGAAWALNPFLVGALPLLLLGLGWWWAAVVRGRRAHVLTAMRSRLVLAAALVWAMARNLVRLL